MIKKMLLSVLSLVFMLSGCATIIKGNARELNLDKPNGAEVYVDDQLVGKTPYRIKLENNKTLKFCLFTPYTSKYE